MNEHPNEAEVVLEPNLATLIYKHRVRAVALWLALQACTKQDMPTKEFGNEVTGLAYNFEMWILREVQPKKGEVE